jgi:hypothetical protein
MVKFLLAQAIAAISACYGLPRTGKFTAMSGISASLTLESKWIRPGKPVIKRRDFPAEFSLDV